jgi:hypothetical protein
VQHDNAPPSQEAAMAEAGAPAGMTRPPTEADHFHLSWVESARSAHKLGMHTLFPCALWTLIGLIVLSSGVAILAW